MSESVLLLPFASAVVVTLGSIGRRPHVARSRHIVEDPPPKSLLARLLQPGWITSPPSDSLLTPVPGRRPPW